MYEAYCGLHQRPFAAAPTTSLYYPSRLMSEAFGTLVRLVERDEGVGMVVGPTGTGKTLLCHLLAEHFQKQLAVVLLPSGRLTSRRALLQHILFGLKLPYRQMDEGELRLSLLDFLEARHQASATVLLVIDEAHTLPIRVLEELRLLSNLVRSGQTRVRLILAGHPVLEERLVVPRLEPLNQRIGARCYLGNLTGHETAQFICHQIRACGGDPERIFTAGACAAVARYTDGIPRLINQLCDHALILAFVDERLPVDETLIEEAWCDLQRLPMRPTTTPGAEGTLSDGKDSVVEFGVLNDTTTESSREVALDEQSSLVSASPLETISNQSPTPGDAGSQAQTHFSTTVKSPDQGGRVAAPAQVSYHNEEAETAQFGQPSAPTTPTPLKAIDPFDGHFAEEEIVVDRLAESPLPTVSVRRAAAYSDGERCALSSAAPQPAPTDGLQHSEMSAGPLGQPATADSNVPETPDVDLAWEDRLLQESLAMLWSQPVIAAHCLPGDHLLSAPVIPVVQPVQQVRAANR